MGFNSGFKGLMKLEYSSSLRLDYFWVMLKMNTGSLSEISAIIHKSSHSVRNVVTLLTDRLFLWPVSMYTVFILKIDAWIQYENIQTYSLKIKHVNTTRGTLQWTLSRVHVSGSIYKIIWTRLLQSHSGNYPSVNRA